MGLFSFLNKNKQETAGEDGAYYSRADDETVAARARSKRASSAGDPAPRRGKDAKAAAADPVLPEKKRARRRLVGAVALALAVAVGLPMLLDSEPKPLSSDIAIQIPSKDKAAPLPVPAPSNVPAAEALDKREEIVAPPKAAAPAVTAAPAVAEVTAPPAKPEAPKPEPKAAAKAEAKAEAKPAVKAPAREDKPAVAAKPAAASDDARALAILEGKGGGAESQKYVLQVAALASQEKVNELQGKLKDAGIKSFTQKGSAGEKTVIRVRVGPFSKEEAEKMRARLDKLGLSGSMIPT